MPIPVAISAIASAIGRTSVMAGQTLSGIGKVVATTARTGIRTGYAVFKDMKTTRLLKSRLSAVDKMKKEANKLKKKKNVIRPLAVRVAEAKRLAEIFILFIRNSIQTGAFGQKTKSPFTMLTQRRTNPIALWHTGSLYKFQKRRGAFSHLSSYKPPEEGAEKIDLTNYMGIKVNGDTVSAGFNETLLYREPSNAYTPRKKSITVRRLLDILEHGGMIPHDPKTAKGRRVLRWYFYVKSRISSSFKVKAFLNKNKILAQGGGGWRIPARPFFDKAVAIFTAKYKTKNVRIERLAGVRRISIRVLK